MNDFIEFVKNTFFVDKEMYQAVSEEIAVENRKCLRITSALAAVSFTFMTLLSFFVSSIHGNLPIYLVFMLLGYLFLFLSCNVQSPVGIQLQLYAFVFMILLFGVILGTVFSPQELTVSYVVLLFAIPLLYVGKPLFMNLAMLSSIVAYVVIGYYEQTREMLLYNMINIGIYGLLSMLMAAFFINMKIQRIYYLRQNNILEQEEQREVEKAALTDKLTGCKNRNALAWAYKGDYDKELPIAVIMCDLNGLKQANDTNGHLAGDEFITRVSKNLIDTFGADDVYRIGGDEFLVVVLGEGVNGLSEKVAQFMEKAGEDVSLGVIEKAKTDSSFDDLQKAADKEMYHAKRKFYAIHPERDARQAAMEYHDIVSSAGIGIWHILLKDGERARMQADDTMMELLGVDDSIGTEEAIYAHWHDRIIPSARPSVEASVKEMMDGKFSENTYMWEHPTLGPIYVRCGGTAVEKPDGTVVLRGYHYNVTDIILKEQRKQNGLV